MNHLIPEDLLNQNAAALDITPSMYKDATEHYKAVATYLRNQGIMADFYPQGSFSTGTVVRPYNKDDDYFDLDVVAKRTDIAQANATPARVRNSVKEALEESKQYHSMLSTCNECLTLNYVQDGKRGGFRLDIVIGIGKGAHLNNHATSDPISIAKEDGNWLYSNPKALTTWFKGINDGFVATIRESARTRIFESNRDIFGSIEEVPDSAIRTSLQRSIQILKRSRDIFSSRAKLAAELIPSCAITVLATAIADGQPRELGTGRLLQIILSELEFAFGTGAPAINNILAKAKDPSTGGPLVKWEPDDTKTLLRWVRNLSNSLQQDSGNRDRMVEGLQDIFGERAKLPASNESSLIIPILNVKPTRPWAI